MKKSKNRGLSTKALFITGLALAVLIGIPLAWLTLTKPPSPYTVKAKPSVRVKIPQPPPLPSQPTETITDRTHTGAQQVPATPPLTQDDADSLEQDLPKPEQASAITPATDIPMPQASSGDASETAASSDADAGPTSQTEQTGTYPAPVAEEKVQKTAVAAPATDLAAEEKADPTAAAPRHTVSPSSERALFTIQVGAFREKAYAQQAEHRLKGKGYAAYILESADGGKGRWFFVRFGRFSNRQEAVMSLAGFKQQEKMDGMVTAFKTH